MMTPLSYHSLNLSLIALETMRLLVQILLLLQKNTATHFLFFLVKFYLSKNYNSKQPRNQDFSQNYLYLRHVHLVERVKGTAVSITSFHRNKVTLL